MINDSSLIIAVSKVIAHGFFKKSSSPAFYRSDSTAATLGYTLELPSKLIYLGENYIEFRLF